MRTTLIILSLFFCSCTKAQSGFLGRVQTVDGIVPLTVTEYKTFYRGEVWLNKDVDTSTNSGTDITDFLPISPSESVTAYTTNGSSATLYGKIYNASLTVVATVGSLTASASQTFTTPSTAAYLVMYTRYGGTNFQSVLNIRSTSTITYNTPITPNNYTGTDGQKINAALRFQQFLSSPVIVPAGTYQVTESIVMNSGNKLVLNSATLKLACHDNIIRNEAIAGTTIFHRGNRSISITGTGTASVEGYDYANWGMDVNGLAAAQWKPVALLFANVQNSRVSGLTCKGTNAWAMDFEQCRYDTVKNIVFNENLERQNQDGLDIRRGSHHFVVDSISGQTGDDIIALTNLGGYMNYNILGATVYEPGAVLDIHDIAITNVTAKKINAIIGAGSGYPPQYGSGILFLTEDGLKEYNVTLTNVAGDSSQIVLGWTRNSYATTQQATVADMYNMNISNTGTAAVYLNRPVHDCSILDAAATDYTNTFSCVVFKSGSLNVSRRYTGGSLETFTTVP